MTTMRVKVQLAQIADVVGGAKQCIFGAQYDADETSICEGEYPYASLTVVVDNPAAIAALTLGDSYFLDITPAT